MEHSMVPQTPDQKKHRKYINHKTAVIGAVVFVFLVMLWYYVPVMGSNEASYCARCHSMIPEYLTWQESNHAQFQCKACHQEPGVKNFIKYQGKLFREIVFYRAGSGKSKTVEPGVVPNDACLKCHSENRHYSASSDTVIPHSKHQAKGVKCVTCHAGVAHGRIVERGVTEKVPPDQWNFALAKEQMDFKYTTPRMAVCLDCHGKRQVTEKCSDCHSRQIVPASHKSGDFERQHGISAQKDFKPCNLCHVYSLREPADLLQMNVQDYVKANTFCFNCHLTKPSTHKNPKFMQQHDDLVRERGIANCTGCHDINEDKKNKDRGPINSVYCNKCHWFN